VPLVLIANIDGGRGVRQTRPVGVVCGLVFALGQYQQTFRRLCDIAGLRGAHEVGRGDAMTAVCTRLRAGLIESPVSVSFPLVGGMVAQYDSC
jgi:hypothetical protein